MFLRFQQIQFKYKATSLLLQTFRTVFQTIVKISITRFLFKLIYMNSLRTPCFSFNAKLIIPEPS